MTCAEKGWRVTVLGPLNWPLLQPNTPFLETNLHVTGFRFRSHLWLSYSGTTALGRWRAGSHRQLTSQLRCLSPGDETTGLRVPGRGGVIWGHPPRPPRGPSCLILHGQNLFNNEDNGASRGKRSRLCNQLPWRSHKWKISRRVMRICVAGWSGLWVQTGGFNCILATLLDY